MRTVRRRVPVCAALRTGHDDDPAVRLWPEPRSFDRTAFLIDADRPRLPDEGLAQEILAGCPIEHVEEAVAVAPEHDLARLALPFDVGQHGNLRRIPVILVARRELIIPLEPAAVGIERHYAIGIEIVAGGANVAT